MLGYLSYNLFFRLFQTNKIAITAITTATSVRIDGVCSLPNTRETEKRTMVEKTSMKKTETASLIAVSADKVLHSLNSIIF